MPDDSTVPEGKVSVYHQETGERVTYWPRDAAEVVGAPGSKWGMNPPPETPTKKPSTRKAAKKAAPKKKAVPKKRR